MYRSPVDGTTPRVWLGRRVLVTGASGFLGGAVCDVLLGAGAEVHGTGRSRLPPREVVAHHASRPDDLGEIVARVRPEVVLHLASPVELGREPELYARLRPGILDASAALGRACLQAGVRLVHVGTCEELAGGTVPFGPEALAPTSPYSALKAAAAAWLQMLARTHGLELVVARPFRCFGPGEARGLVPAACRAALLGQPLPTTDGRQVREWNHVDAVAKGLVALAASPRAAGGAWNLGGGPRLSVAEVVARIFARAGAEPSLVQAGALPRRPGEVEAFWGDHAATDALIGPLPHPPLDEALDETLAWHRARLETAAVPPEATAPPEAAS